MNPDDTCSAHIVNPEFGSSYWRKFAFCSDGSVVIGTGMTAAGAGWDVAHEVEKKEAYLTLPDVERLQLLVEGDLLDTDKIEAIRLMAKLIIKQQRQVNLI